MLELPMGLLYNYGLGPLANALRPTPLWAVLECSPPRAVIPASAPQAVQWGHNTWSDLHATPQPGITPRAGFGPGTFRKVTRRGGTGCR